MIIRVTVAAALAALLVAPIALAEPLHTPLLDAKLVTIQGQPVSGGCQYELSVTLRPGQPAVEQHGVSEDPATCIMVVEQGTPADAGSGQADAALASLRVGETATTPSSSATGLTATAATTTHSAGYHRT